MSIFVFLGKIKSIMAEKALSNASYETYLALEAESDTKYEYHNGFIVAMAGGTPLHSQLCANAGRFIGNAIDDAGKRCIVYTSDLKVRIESANRTYYPDVPICCEAPQFSVKDPNALVNPTLIVEVLSTSTENDDRLLKFHHYRQLASLQEYLLISQAEPEVITHFKQAEDLWEIKTIRGLSASVQLKSLGCTVQMKDLYRSVKF